SVVVSSEKGSSGLYDIKDKLDQFQDDISGIVDEQIKLTGFRPADPGYDPLFAEIENLQPQKRIDAAEEAERREYYEKRDLRRKMKNKTIQSGSSLNVSAKLHSASSSAQRPQSANRSQSPQNNRRNKKE